MWKKRVEQIASDNLHGASFLLQQAVELFEKIDSKQVAKEAAFALQNAKPFMAPLYNFSKHILQNVSNYKDEARTFFENEREEQKRVVEKAQELFFDGCCVLTHSYSSLVAETLIKASRKFKIKVYCTESRPMREGVELAKKLLQNGIETRLIVDAAAGWTTKRCDFVLFGADGIGTFGLVHKLGSYPIALSANHNRIPVYSIATTARQIGRAHV